MSTSFLYWLIMAIWLIFGLWANWTPVSAPGQGQAGWVRFRPMGGTVLLFILLVILGWKVFGQPLHN